MKSLLLLPTLLTVLLIGCSPENRTNGNIGATATTSGAGACPVGYWYSNGQCSNGTNTTNSAFAFNNGFYADNYSGTTRLNIVNADKMKEFYKLGMGVCDRGSQSYQNLGSADCSYYITGYTDIIIQFPAQLNGNALVTIIARPKVNPYVNYSGQLPSGWNLLGIAVGYATGYSLPYIPDINYYNGVERNPLQIQMTVSPINNNAGFIAQGYGDAWTGLNQTVVAIEVTSGSANSTNLNYSFKIGGVAAATGTMTRCQTQNCGL
ncbi:MAG: hypothetical protein AABY53_01490 [Bdellovibrionota bacterium]